MNQAFGQVLHTMTSPCFNALNLSAVRHTEANLSTRVRLPTFWELMLHSPENVPHCFNVNFFKSIGTVYIYINTKELTPTLFHIDFLLQVFTVRVFIVIMLMRRR